MHTSRLSIKKAARLIAGLRNTDLFKVFLVFPYAMGRLFEMSGQGRAMSFLAAITFPNNLLEAAVLH